MIWESNYWKKDLLKISKKLEKRLNQKKWFDSSFANAEKEIMISAFMIRKLFDSNKLDKRLEDNDIDAIYYESNGKKINWMKNLFPERYFNLDKPESKKVKIREVCNQIIHSYVFTLLNNESNQLYSFWFVSDYSKFKYLIELKLVDYIQLVEFIGNYWPTSELYLFDSKSNDYKVYHDFSQTEIDEIMKNNNNA